MAVDDFLKHFKTAPKFRLLAQRYTQALFNFMGQSIACNRLHTVNQRCARWLLLTHDRVNGDEFDLTARIPGDNAWREPSGREHRRRHAAGSGLYQLPARAREHPRPCRAGIGRMRVLSHQRCRIRTRTARRDGLGGVHRKNGDHYGALSALHDVQFF